MDTDAAPRSVSQAPAPRKTRRGFNLIEAAIVLGVVGLVIGGIWIAATAVSDHLKVSETAKGLLSTCDKASRTFPMGLAPSCCGENDVLSAAIDAGVFPRDWVSNGTVKPPASGGLVMSWHDVNEIYGGVSFAGDTSIYLVDMPRKFCRRLLPLVHTRSNATLLWVTVGTGGYDYSWTDGNTYPLPYSGNISDACDVADMVKLEFVCRPR